MMNFVTRHPAYRPLICDICNAPMPRAVRGRPRITCSDRCRQIKRRQNYRTWIDPRQHAKDNRRAEREIRRLERLLGPLDDPVPGYDHFTLRDRLKIRFARGMRVQFCRVCRRPYCDDRWRRNQTCSARCTRAYVRQQKALKEGLAQYAGRYDGRVDVRLRLGLPIKTCAHCGIPFPPYHPRRIYCSKRCNNAAWRARHPLRTCPMCKTRYRGTRLTCCLRCNSARWRQAAMFCDRCHRAIKPGRAMRYEPSYNGPDPAPIRGHRGVMKRFEDAVFCSAKCRDAVGWLPSYKICDECRTMYYPSSRTGQRSQRYCSNACKQRAQMRARVERTRAAGGVRLCECCGAALPWTRGWGKRRFCSAGCKRQVQNQRQRERYALRRGAGILVQMPVRVWEVLGA